MGYLNEWKNEHGIMENIYCYSHVNDIQLLLLIVVKLSSNRWIYNFRGEKWQ